MCDRHQHGWHIRDWTGEPPETKAGISSAWVKVSVSVTDLYVWPIRDITHTVTQSSSHSSPLHLQLCDHHTRDWTTEPKAWVATVWLSEPGTGILCGLGTQCDTTCMLTGGLQKHWFFFHSLNINIFIEQFYHPQKLLTHILHWLHQASVC